MRKFGSAALAAIFTAGALAAATPASAAEVRTVKETVALASAKVNGKTYRAKATQTFKIRVGGAQAAASIRAYDLDINYNVPTGYKATTTVGKPAVTVESCSVVVKSKYKCTVVRTKVTARVVTPKGSVHKGSKTVTTEVSRLGRVATWVR